jgi:tRNA G37 N-methylase Trm5
MPQKKPLDPFAQVRSQTLRHRAQHGCGTYPFEDGAILGVVAAAVAPEHVRLARENFSAFGVADRVTVHQGDFAGVLPKLAAGYDLAFFDGFSPTSDYLRAFQRLVRRGGVLISSNLHFRDAETRAYRELLFDGGTWLTGAIADGDTAMSVRL